jgi:hypothetical protein
MFILFMTKTSKPQKKKKILAKSWHNSLAVAEFVQNSFLQKFVKYKKVLQVQRDSQQNKTWNHFQRTIGNMLQLT